MLGQRNEAQTCVTSWKFWDWEMLPWNAGKSVLPYPRRNVFDRALDLNWSMMTKFKVICSIYDWWEIPVLWRDIIHLIYANFIRRSDEWQIYMCENYIRLAVVSTCRSLEYRQCNSDTHNIAVKVIFSASGRRWLMCSLIQYLQYQFGSEYVCLILPHGSWIE